MNSPDQWTREAEFHDDWAAATDPASVLVRESVWGPTALENTFILQRLGDLKGKRVLDIGCGLGEASVAFALLGAEVTTTDLSPGMVAAAKKLAQHHNVQLTGLVGAAEQLDLPPNSFDVIYTANTLHHLADMPAFLASAARLLAPHGHFCSWDPVKYNPVINVYRRLAHAVRTEDERPLGKKDVEMIRQHFGQVTTRHFWLLGLSLFIKYFLIDRISPNQERYWKRIYKEQPATLWWWRPLAAMDNILLRLPIIRWLSWNIVIIATKTTKNPQA